MPLKLNVGLSKKIGLPDYGSLGASCHVEVELEHSLLDRDLEEFHDRVRKVYVACRQAVQDELARQQGHANDSDATHPPARNGSANGATGSGSSGHAATARQLEYARELAKQISGVGVRRLESLSQRMHSKPLAALSSIEASALIDVLKDVKAGRLALNEMLNGAAA